eukprot:c16007_g1_i1.p1 GENE.c16007_g1_i1~~c16007_g1_i1.p1  ORF type:complete len:315 (-),score=70.14 c16007_g1_i1:94-1038(-)
MFRWSCFFTDDGRYLITCSADWKVTVFDVHNDFSIKSQKIAPGTLALLDSCLVGNGELIAQSSISNQLMLHQLESETLETSMIELPNVRMIAGIAANILHPHLVGLACGGTPCTPVIILDLETQTIVSKAHSDDSDASTAAFLDDRGQVLCNGSRSEKFVRLWDVRQKMVHPIGLLTGHTGHVTFVQSKLDDIHILTNATDNSAKIFDVRMLSDAIDDETRDCSIQTLVGHTVGSAPIACCFSPSYTRHTVVLSGSDSGGIHAYCSKVGTPIGVLQGSQGCVIRQCAWSPTAPIVVAHTASGEVLVWDAPDYIS